MTASPRLRPAALAGLLLTSVLAGCSQKPPTKEEEKIAPVKVVEAKKAKLSVRTELLGTTMPLPGHVAQVSAPVSGQVVEVLVGPKKGVVEGAHVKEGQPLVRLDDSIARANRDKAAAALADLAEQKKQAEFAVELAGIEVKRLEELGGSAGGSMPLVSKVELEKARVARKDAQSKLEGMLSRQKSAEAELKSLNAQLAFYTLKAPIAGHLGLVQASPGQTLAAGTVVADVVDLDEIDVLCHAPPSAARELKLWQEAHIAGEDKLVGHVVFIAVQAQPETGNFDVKVRFPNKDAKLAANAVKRVEVVTRTGKEECWAVDEKAVIEDQEPPLVVVTAEKKDKDGKVEKDKDGKVKLVALRLKATLGVRDRKQGLIEIKGLRLETDKKKEVSPEGQKFIVEGAHGLESGDDLKIEKGEDD